jgi:hypothetical protein
VGVDGNRQNNALATGSIGYLVVRACCDKGVSRLRSVAAANGEHTNQNQAAGASPYCNHGGSVEESERRGNRINKTAGLERLVAGESPPLFNRRHFY